MTKRDFLNAVISAAISEELTAYATKAIATLDAQTEKRKTSETAVKAAAERDTFDKTLLALIPRGDTFTTAQLLPLMPSATPSKISQSLRRLVEGGKLMDCGYTRGAKKSAVKQYRLI